MTNINNARTALLQSDHTLTLFIRHCLHQNTRFVVLLLFSKTSNTPFPFSDCCVCFFFSLAFVFFPPLVLIQIYVTNGSETFAKPKREITGKIQFNHVPLGCRTEPLKWWKCMRIHITTINARTIRMRVSVSSPTKWGNARNSG